MNTDIAQAHRAVADARIALNWSRAGLAGYEKRLLGSEANIAGVQQEMLNQRQEVADAETRLQQAREVYRELAGGAPPLWPDGPKDPVLLLPLRLETVFRTTDGGEPELWIRAYPDEIHVDSHETALTATERTATETYWKAVWAAGGNQERRSAAWRHLVAVIGPGRATWAAKHYHPRGEPSTTETPDGADALDPGPFTDEPPARESSWTRAAHTYVLPDRLVFSGYQVTGDGQIGLVWRQEGAAVPETLDVGLGPGATAPPLWLTDFAKAVEVGMAVRVPLTGLPRHFDLLTVTGVRGGPSQHTAGLVGTLLEAHRCTDGLSVLPTGTPTNNTAEKRSAWQSRGPQAAPEQLAAQRAAFVPGSRQAAARIAHALGPAAGSVLTDVPDGLTEDDHDVLLHLRTALGALAAASTNWRALDLREEEETIHPDLLFLVSHYVDHVHGRGSLPSVRVGRQPYGILPATSLDLWHGTEVDLRILNHLLGFRTFAESQGWRAPSVVSGGDPDATLNDLLHRLPASRRLRFYLQTPKTPPYEPLPETPIGTIPYLSGFTWAERPDPEAVPPAPPLEFDVRQETTQELRELVDHSPVRGMWDWWQETAPLLAAQHEMTPERAERLRAFQTVISGASTGKLGLFYHMATMVLRMHREALRRQLEDHGGRVEPRVRLLDGHLAAPAGVVPDSYDWICLALDQLSEVEDRARGDLRHVERLLCEVLDTQTHRLDAWTTSAASARLARLRTDSPVGTHLGAYGWVTGVTPRARPQQADEQESGNPGGETPDEVTGEGTEEAPLTDTEGPGGESDPQGTHDGYLIAPSMHHATTLAVLRSGWLTHTNREAFGINLTSSRVRRALSAVDGIRSGQTLGALLGYRLERSLHDAQLDVLIRPLRVNYPVPDLVDPGTDGSDEARTAMAAESVVDGQALLDDWLAHGRLLADLGLDVTEADLPLLAQADGVVQELETTVDAVGDLLLAESVHQLVGDNPARAGAAADGIARGDRLPQEFDVIRTPRSAVAVTHRLGLLTPAGGTNGWADGRPLAALEPSLERWCQIRLGDASAWTFDFGDPAAPLTVALPELGICALEAVLGSGPADDPVDDKPDDAATRDNALTLRLLRQAAARAGSPGAAPPRVTGASAARFAVLQQLCRSLARVLRDARPLLTSDLVAAEADSWAGADLRELWTRVTTWLDAVRMNLAWVREQAKLLPDGAETLTRYLDALADHGVHSAYTLGPPGDPTGVEAVRAQASFVLDHFNAAPLATVPEPPPEPSAALEWVTAVRTAVAGVLGESLPVLPVLRLSGTDAGTALTAPRPDGADDDAVTDWLLDMERVRPRARTLGDALAASEVLASGPPSGFTVAQSPGGRPWIARGPATVPSRSEPAPTQCAVLRTDGPPDADRVTGLVVDAWTETAPEPVDEEMGALAFHYNQPDARAPQAWLLAVPPDPSRGWCMEDLHAVVEETFALARVRGMDLTDVAELRGLLPVQWAEPPTGGIH
ncbi:flagellar export protein FliJ [Streptomyces pseudogriseolus]|uniref:flagellar export protein FliJ n=1 Tax=Streptomyces pseudogriseolus TaxID=36817 RepID=UPI001CE32CA7|nr:flagellar export protein FliJ [Streptomyces pseudogriseolus]